MTVKGPALQQWVIDSPGSSIVVEARSSVGPIAWEALGPTGSFRVAVVDGAPRLDVAPEGELSIDLTAMRSGNALYDAELHRRLNVRQHPRALVRLTSASPTAGPPIRAEAELTLHGVTASLEGVLEVEVVEESLHIKGTQRVDIRAFGIPLPQMLMLQVFPDVRVHLFLRGTLA